jgi:hypothetical protein
MIVPDIAHVLVSFLGGHLSSAGYQTVDGVKLPEHVAVIRESHHEVWRYRLSDCIVKISK